MPKRSLFGSLKVRTFVAAGLLGLCAAISGARAAVPANLGSALELFVDDHMIERLDGARLRLHEPQPAGVALQLDRPWEGGGTGFFTVLRDRDLYRMYYVGLPLTDRNDDVNSYPCYAESHDGITWTRPELGLCEFRGSKQNNILMLPDVTEPYASNFSPFIDTRPGVPADERFKATGGANPGRENKSTKAGLWMLASGDGIHWRKWREDPILHAEAVTGSDGHNDFDMQNSAFWSESEQCYVLYYRIATDAPPDSPLARARGSRNIARRTSSDLIHWSPPQRMSYGNTELEQLYTISTFPYFRAPHIYLSLPMRFIHGRRFLTDAQLAARAIGPMFADEKTPHEVSDSVLMTTRGGTRFDRTFMEAFIRPGPDLGNWVSRDGMSATGIIATGPNEISLYHQRNFAQPTAYLARYTLRTDGFISVNAPYAGGEMVTKPLVVSGRSLVINFATSAPGSVRVEVQEADGEPIPGFSLMESHDLVGDSVEYAVRWGKADDLSSLLGRTVRLRFVMKDADLYSLRFK